MRQLKDLPVRQSSAIVACSQEQLSFVNFAVETVKKAGFTFVYSSMKSEACYYRLGDRIGSLRIAAHRYGHRSEGRELAFPVWSCLTFNKPEYKTAASLLSEIDHAVGRYIMYPHTKLSLSRDKLIDLKHLFLVDDD